VGPLVTTEWLATRLGGPGLRVVDARWYLDPAKQGSEAYAAGHIPGAVFMDAASDLSAPGGRRGGPIGRLPGRTPSRCPVMGAAGIGPETDVVAYDDQAGAVAGRLWYVLRAHRHDRVAVLDGGLAKWIEEGRPLTTELPVIAAAAFRARPRPGFVVTKADMLAREPDALVLDARAAERFRGEVEPIDAAWHILAPRARPTQPTDTRPDAGLPSRRCAAPRYAPRGRPQEPIVYCGSGITACHDLLALEIAGLRGRLYAGSWSEWSSDPALPADLGEK
jgi:thiosulfate/3-mercaptopyruvate sulfurtransferase